MHDQSGTWLLWLSLDEYTRVSGQITPWLFSAQFLTQYNNMYLYILPGHSYHFCFGTVLLSNIRKNAVHSVYFHKHAICQCQLQVLWVQRIRTSMHFTRLSPSFKQHSVAILRRWPHDCLNAVKSKGNSDDSGSDTLSLNSLNECQELSKSGMVPIEICLALAQTA